jgi:integrase
MAGSIRKRGSTYQIQLRWVDPETGRPTGVSTTRPTKKQAETALAELIVQRDQRRIIRRSETFQQLADKWLEKGIAEDRFTPKTLANYRRFVKKDGRMMKALGGIKCHQLTNRHIDTYMTSISYLSANTRRCEIQALRSICKLGVRWGWMVKNPATDAWQPPRPDTTINLPDTIDPILKVAQAHGPYEDALVNLAIATGMRHGELAGLRWQYIDWKAGTISVAWQIVSSGECTMPKSASGRTFNVGKDTLTILHAWRRIQMMEWNELYDQLPKFVFSRRPGTSTRTIYESVGRAWRSVRDAAGYPNMRLHDCRHLNVTALLEAGVPVKAVSDRVGHANPTITLAVYAQKMGKADRDAADVMDKLMRGTA